MKSETILVWSISDEVYCKELMVNNRYRWANTRLKKKKFYPERKSKEEREGYLQVAFSL